MAPTRVKQAGRVAVEIAERLKTRIAVGDLRIGQYLPGARELGREHKVSPETARRAMKIMEAEHWVSGHPGHGFKITARGNDPGNAAPVAFILSGLIGGGRWSSFCQCLQAAIHRAAEERGWSVLGLAAEGRSTSDLSEQLRTARASGLLLDTHHQPLIAALARLGMPAVMVEETGGGSRLDCVTQDNFGGAAAAAEHLAGRGHRRIGWYGLVAPTVASRERWGGAMAALRDRGASLDAGHAVDSASPDGGRRLRELLSGPERPSGLLALWWDGAVAVMQLASELGLVPGEDLELVSWCPEELLPEFRAACPGGKLPATMVWSMRQLAEAALARLAERRARPDAPPVRIVVETRLLAAEAT